MAVKVKKTAPAPKVVTEALENLYTYRVFWSETDQAFIALCAEFPSMSVLEDSQAAALTELIELVRFVLEDLPADKRPVPLVKRKYTGRFQVRVTPSLHQRLTVEAAEAKVSLNRLITDKLAR